VFCTAAAGTTDQSVQGKGIVVAPVLQKPIPRGSQVPVPRRLIFEKYVLARALERIVTARRAEGLEIEKASLVGALRAVSLCSSRSTKRSAARNAAVLICISRRRAGRSRKIWKERRTTVGGCGSLSRPTPCASTSTRPARRWCSSATSASTSLPSYSRREVARGELGLLRCLPVPCQPRGCLTLWCFLHIRGYFI